VSVERKECPECKAECWRESCDVGVGVITGPWGCPECGWSEDDRYDLRNGPKKTDAGYTLDQFGGATPPQGFRPPDPHRTYPPRETPPITIDKVVRMGDQVWNRHRLGVAIMIRAACGCGRCDSCVVADAFMAHIKKR
jgi:hypothetical protein